MMIVSLAMVFGMAVSQPPQPLHIQPSSCAELGPERAAVLGPRNLETGTGFQTCPPEGPGRHIYHFEGFEGERVSFSLANGSPSGATDDPMDLSLAVTGPNGYRASGRVKGASLLLNLPHTGRYELVVQNHAAPGISQSPYRIDVTEHEALPPRSYDDCSRLSLPGAQAGLELDSYFLRPGGTAVVRPVLRMRGQTYRMHAGCFTDWAVSSPQARLARTRVGNWTVIVDPQAPEGTSIRVTASAGAQQAVNSFTVDSTEQPDR